MNPDAALARFIDANRLYASVKPTDSNPNMEDGKYPMDHWLVIIRKKLNRSSMRVHFSKGSGHNGRPPTLMEVLDCIASDASGIDQPFESWARDLGYDTDSRKAEQTYKVCALQAQRLHKLLGNPAYDELLNLERL